MGMGGAQLMPCGFPPGPQAGAVLLPSVYPLTGWPAAGLQTMACLFATAGRPARGPGAVIKAR